MATRRPQSPPARKPRHYLFIAGLWALALAAYWNSFSAGLVFDSQRVILADSRIQTDTPDNVHQIWTGDYYNGTGSGALYRPLTTLTYLWNYAVLGDGPNPAGYHTVNFLIHAANVALLYLLGLIIFGDEWTAFAQAAIWAVHPILTEAVTNVVGRADLLSGLGVLAGLLCYIRGASASGWRRWAAIAGLAASAAIAVFSKESGVILLGVMVTYDVAFAPKLSWRDRGLLYAGAAVPVAIFFAMRRTALAQVSSLLISYGDNPLQGAGFVASRLTAFKVLAKYLGLLIWPATLSPDYSYNAIPVSAAITSMLAFVLWLGIAATAIYAFRRAPAIFFFVGFFAVTIAPVANLVILVGSIMAERFLYLPAIGFLGVVVWLGRRYVPAKWQALALTTICLNLVLRTYARNIDWHDERSLWTSAVAAAPASYKTHHNLAQLMLADPHPDFNSATREIDKALSILDPLPDSRNMPSVYATAGRCYRERGDLPKALALLVRGRAIDRAWNEAFLQRNREDGKTVSSVGTPPLYLELARVYRDLGQPDNALEALRFGRTIDPQPAFFEELSRTYVGMRQPDQAAISLLEGLVAAGNQPELLSQATQLYQETAPDGCALNRTPTGVTLNVNCPMVHGQVCTASANVVAMFQQMRDPTSANATSQNAVRTFGCPPEQFR